MFTQMVAGVVRSKVARLVVILACSIIILSTTLAQRIPAGAAATSDPAQTGNRVYLPVVFTKAEGQTPAPTPTTPALRW